MLDTYATILTETSRNLIRNARDNPVLYVMFTLMILFSVLVIAGLTVFGLQSELAINLRDIMIALFFVFLLKTAVDIYKYFINSEAVTYALTMPVPHWKTMGNIFLAVFWTQLGIWVFFSGIYSILLVLAGVNLGYPSEYLQFTFSVILAGFLGTSLALHFFSEKRWRLIGVPIIIGLYLYFDSIYVLIALIGISALYCFYSMHHVLDAYLFARRKKRRQTPTQRLFSTPLRSIFHKETTVMWRDNLYQSYIVTTAVTGAITGYLTIYGEEILIPEALRESLENLMPFLYVFIGGYIVTVYTAVFPTLNMFFNEEKTLWVLRHIPLSSETIVAGKASSILLSFITAIPFLAFYVAFTGFEYLGFATWLLIFSFLAGVILSLPLGVRYLGKKSDILVLYSVALLVFIISSLGAGVSTVLDFFPGFQLVFYLGSIGVELIILFGSIQLAGISFDPKYVKPRSFGNLLK